MCIFIPEMPVLRFSLCTPWKEAGEGTKRYHTRKTDQSVIAIIKDMAPKCPMHAAVPDNVFHASHSTKVSK